MKVRVYRNCDECARVYGKNTVCSYDSDVYSIDQDNDRFLVWDGGTNEYRNLYSMEKRVFHREEGNPAGFTWVHFGGVFVIDGVCISEVELVEE